MERSVAIVIVIVTVPMCYGTIPDEYLKQYDEHFGELEMVINCMPEFLRAGLECETLEEALIVHKRALEVYVQKYNLKKDCNTYIWLDNVVPIYFDNSSFTYDEELYGDYKALSPDFFDLLKEEKKVVEEKSAIILVFFFCVIAKGMPISVMRVERD